MKYLFFILLFFCSKAHSGDVEILPMWDKDESTHFKILLPSDNSLKSAVFQHNGYSYFIFDTNDKLSIEEQELKKLNLVQLEHPSTLILRGVFDTPLHPFLKQKESNVYSIKVLCSTF